MRATTHHTPLAEYVSPRELAESLGTSRGQIHRWIRAGRLRAIRIGKLVRIERAEADRFFADAAIGGAR